MSYYDKYLKYKNKYLQYKNSLGLNMQGGNYPKYPKPSVNVNSNDIFHINNLTDTPVIDLEPKTYKHNKISSIEKLSDTPHMSEFAGGAYINKRKIKSKYEQDKLLKLLDPHADKRNSHSGSSENTEEEDLLDDFKKYSPIITDMKKHKYFGTPSDSSSSDS
jgi:hypothetical protein